MYLSRVRVATEGLDRKALLALTAGDAYGNHQLLWQMFTDQQERKFLFRQEIEQEQLSLGLDPRGLPLFYVLSEEPPTSVPGLLQAETKMMAPRLREGDALTYRLRANPTVARKKGGQGRSVRHDVLMDAKKQCQNAGVADSSDIKAHMDAAAGDWLAQRAINAGFELSAEPLVSGYRQHVIRRKGQEIRFSSIDYEGVLTVSAPEKFAQTLNQGLGRSRAFGCGLMLVKRA